VIVGNWGRLFHNFFMVLRPAVLETAADLIAYIDELQQADKQI